MEPERISRQDVRRKLEAGEKVVFIDARSAEAWGESEVQILGSIRVPPDEAEHHLREIPQEGTLVTYCT